jgi:non-specific serine/threonine protein kinase
MLAEALQLSTEQAETLLVLSQGGAGVEGHTADQQSAGANLPRQLSSFVGRALEVARLEQLVEHQPLVTLIGPGGVGKTRLAFEVAARVGPNVAERTYLVEFASLTEMSLVPERLAAALGITERARGTLMATLAEIVGQRALLLVLDNCEHVVEVCAQLTENLLQHCPRAHHRDEP